MRSLLLLALLGCEDTATGEVEADVEERRDDAGVDTVDGALPPGQICVDGQTRCIDGRFATCLEGGQGWLAEDCPERSVCVDGQCAEYVCATGERRCTDEGVQACVDGDWGPSNPCPEAESCVDGVYLARSCKPGERACGAGRGGECSPTVAPT